MALTDKQKLFADEYLIDLNATRAYKAVYKNVKNDDVAAVNGNRMLRNAKVAEYIKQRMEERSKRTEITQDFVLKELYEIAKANGTDFAQVVDEPIILNGSYVMDPDTGKLKTYETIKVTPTDKLLEEKKKAISGIKEGKYGIEVSTCDKVRALELLGKHLGMFTDNIKLKGDANTEISLDFINNKYIPIIMLMIGTCINVLMNIPNINATVILGGMISGLASTGLYEALRNLIDKDGKKEA